MAEGYVRTSAANVNDLLNQIVGQAGAHGWTVNYLYDLGADGFERGRAGGFSKDGAYVNLASYLTPTLTQYGGDQAAAQVIPARYRTGENYSWNFGNSSSGYQNPDVLAINVGDGYNSGEPWHNQPGADDIYVDSPTAYRNKFKTVRAIGAIGNVHMFFYEDPAAFYVVLEPRPGQFYWLGGGRYQSDFPLNGTHFYGASLQDTDIGNGYPRGAMRFDVRALHSQASPTRSNGWGGFIASTERRYGPTSIESNNVPAGQNVPSYNHWAVNTNTPNTDRVSEVQYSYDGITGRIWANPIRMYMGRVGGNLSYVGSVPHAHLSTTSNFIGGETVSIGGDEFMIFPWNWRESPYNWNTSTTSYDLWGPWYRNNTHGTGWLLRKPA